MPKMTALSTEDREWVAALIETDAQGGIDLSVTRLTRVGRLHLERAIADGEPGIDERLLALAEDGYREQVRTWLKRDTVRVRLQSGTIVSLPAKHGVRARNPLGQTTNEWLQLDWPWKPWHVAEEITASYEREGTTALLKAEAMRAVLRYRELAPDSMSPVDACERLGIDLFGDGLAEAA